jgi:hypothetical protein
VLIGFARVISRSTLAPFQITVKAVALSTLATCFYGWSGLIGSIPLSAGGRKRGHGTIVMQLVALSAVANARSLQLVAHDAFDRASRGHPPYPQTWKFRSESRSRQKE